MGKRVYILSMGDMKSLARQTRGLACLLAETGYEVTVFVRGGKAAPRTIEHPEVCIVFSRFSPSARRASKLLAPLAWIEAFLLAWRNADIVIGVDNSGFAPALAVKLVRPSVVLVSAIANLNSFERRPFVSTSTVLALGARHIDVLVGANELRSVVMRSLLRVDCPSAVVQNAPFEALGPVDDGQDERRDGRLRLVYQGSIRAHAGGPQLLEAMKQCADVAHLTIMGFADSGYEDLLRQTPGVEYLGRLESEAMMEVTRACEVGIALYPYRQSGADLGTIFCGPQKLCEYMACGLPVICSDNPTLREIEQEGWGLCVPAETAEPIAEAIRKLAADRDLRDRMAARARELFRTKYNFRTQAQSFVEIITRLCPPDSDGQNADSNDVR